MRYFLFLSLIGLWFGSLGQITVVPFAQSGPSPEAARLTASTAIDDTLKALPFWDDFSHMGGPEDTLWSKNEDIFINNSIAINPPTPFFVTFDGIDQNGSPYEESATFSGLGDELVSRPIDLTSVPVSRRPSVFLSFFVQLKGRGELPDVRDSLRLQFYAIDSSWVSRDINPNDEQRGLVGGLDNLSFDDDSVQAFVQYMVPVNESRFFHEGFRFRFQSFSNLSGVYDTWHVDYVYLNQDRHANDLSHLDHSLSGQPSSFFDPYYEIPAEEFMNHPQRYLSPLRAHGTNLDLSVPADGTHPLTINHILYNSVSGWQTASGFEVKERMPPGAIGVAFEGLNLSGFPVNEDSLTLRSELIFQTGDKHLFEVIGSNNDTLFLPIDLKVNDTLRQRFTLHNYYAYDDGSAEFAAGINLIGGELAVAFHLSEPDTLTDILIHFPAINPSSVGQALDIKVWSGLDNRLTLRTQPTDIEAAGRNEFQRIKLATPIIVSDTFYIGFKQFTNNYIGVGFDRNNTGGMTAIHTNTNRKWVQNNRLQGSLMIRPVFRSSKDFVLGSGPYAEEENLIFPNPATDEIRITGNYDRVKILNLHGQLLNSYPQKESYSIAHLRPGLYIVQIINRKQTSTIKLIRKP